MPLSPPPMERGGSRGGGSRSRTTDSERGDSFRDRRASPWGPGEGRQDGSRPPRREFVERPERAPTAAESNNQWRSAMRPDPPAQSPVPSRPASEAPSSPALAPAAPATGGRPKLNLTKRTVSEAPGVLSPSLTSDSKASPFGAARPIDTAAREKMIEEKHQQALKEKKEAEEKAKEERRLAKEAAEKEAAEKEVAEKEAAEKAAAEEEAAQATNTNGDAEKSDAPGTTEAATAAETKTENGENAADASEKAPARAPAAAPSRATESGNWRSSTSERGSRGGFSGRGERRGGGGARGGRGFDERQPSRGGRGYEERQFSRGGGRGLEERQPSRRGGEPSTPTTPTVDEDGWTTVSGAAKNRRGRPVAS